jgi:hypothetical protein
MQLRKDYLSAIADSAAVEILRDLDRYNLPKGLLRELINKLPSEISDLLIEHLAGELAQ